MKPINDYWLEFDYDTSPERVYNLTLEQINRLLKEKNLEICVTELSFWPEDQWGGLFCDKHKNHRDQILHLEKTGEQDDPDEWEDKIEMLSEEVSCCDDCITSSDENSIKHFKLIERAS